MYKDVTKEVVLSVSDDVSVVHLGKTMNFDVEIPNKKSSLCKL